MKIVVNTRLLIPNKLDGIGRFTDETLQIITRSHPEHTFYFIFDREYDPKFIYSSNIIPIVISPQARHPFLFLIWFEVSLAWKLRKIKPDVFLSPDGFLVLNSKCKSVAVIHDINFEHYPKDLPYLYAKYYSFMFPKFARKATRIATVSEYSKADIERKYEIPASKIDVVYNGANSIFEPISVKDKEIAKQNFTSGSDYFFFVGTLHPRKNLKNLFLAFEEFKKTDTQNIKLVIAGSKMWWTDDIRLTYEKHAFKSDIIFTGRVSDEDLVKLMGSALSLTYVSFFEGFGIPILEAFNCDTPVITSNITSMPEVAGNAALLVDPFSVNSIADGMKAMVADDKLRNQLIENARIQRSKFSWQQSADKLWQCIERAVK